MPVGRFSTRRRLRTRRGLPRQLFETLEDRCLLADISWNNPAGGSWQIPGNWSPPQVPGNDDNAFITLGGSYSVNLDGAVSVQALTLGSATGSQTLVVNNSLTLGAASVIN